MCDYVCTLPYGHSEKEHETSHGSMSKTRWALDGDEDTALEINGREFGADDSGAPMLCNSVCEAQGRHVHIDYCRTAPGRDCIGTEIQHLQTKIQPHPERAKDSISHSVYWKRSGWNHFFALVGLILMLPRLQRSTTGICAVRHLLTFPPQDPYSKENQTEFGKCDHSCAGAFQPYLGCRHSYAAAADNHKASESGPAKPSYCALPIFHPPQPQSPVVGTGYVSQDGHSFTCANPVVANPAYVILLSPVFDN